MPLVLTSTATVVARIRQMAGYPLVMPPKEYDQLIKALTAWCNAEHGRQKELADHLGVI